MSDEGNWNVFGEFNQPPKGAELKLGPVFYGDVYRDQGDDRFPWRSKLNGQFLGRHATMHEGQERVEWEVCNRVRLMVPAYKKLKARRPQGP